MKMGNHVKFNVPVALREKSREFYGKICGCKSLPSPIPIMDLWEFEGGFVAGLFFYDDANVLPEADLLKAAWLEIKTDDYEGMKARLLAFGVKQVEHGEKKHMYFQAPGGQVYRLARTEEP